MKPIDSDDARWPDAVLAAAVLAVDPIGVGGVRLRARAGVVRERWLGLLASTLPSRAIVPVPLNISSDRLLGGLDLTATLNSGRPTYQQGVLSAAHGGLLQLAMAERLDATTAAHIASALDGHAPPAAGQPASHASSAFGVIALDEGIDAESVPAVIADRLALQLDLDGLSIRDIDQPAGDAYDVDAARRRLPAVQIADAALEALCAGAYALGIDSLRISVLAVAVARVSAALHARKTVDEADIAVAARLVFGPRATLRPRAENDTAADSIEDNAASEPSPQTPTEDPAAAGDRQAPEPGGVDAPDEHDTTDTDAAHAQAPDMDSPADDANQEGSLSEQSMAEIVLAAAQSRLPAGLLEGTAAQMPTTRASAGVSGRSGASQSRGLRGRPVGVRRGEPGPNARLNLVETLRAAAPWQALRARSQADGEPARIRVLREDFRVTRFRQPRQTTTLFAVDASGSSALHRLAEAKGAVELLLADCYVRRDQVGLLAFRGRGAEILLPPTRSLARAKRCLAGLPGGGPTPLASGIDAALEMAEQARRRGTTPVIVLLTDGRGNIARNGTPNRQAAVDDAQAAALRVRLAGHVALVVDTSPRPRAAAQELAAAMAATYLPLPQAGAAELSSAVQSAAA